MQNNLCEPISITPPATQVKVTKLKSGAMKVEYITRASAVFSNTHNLSVDEFVQEQRQVYKDKTLSR